MPQVGIINPGEFAPPISIEIVIWVAVGGRGSLYGAALGAVLVNYAKTYFTGALPEAWLYMLGGLFIATTLFLPKGLVGTVPALIWRLGGGKGDNGDGDGGGGLSRLIEKVRMGGVHG